MRVGLIIKQVVAFSTARLPSAARYINFNQKRTVYVLQNRTVLFVANIWWRNSCGNISMVGMMQPNAIDLSKGITG